VRDRHADSFGTTENTEFTEKNDMKPSRSMNDEPT
jgi:hypothetical protein